MFPTSNMCKYLERLVPERIWWHLENNTILDPRKMGFWPALTFQDSLAVIDQK